MRHPGPFLTLSSVAADRVWHVVDERLDRWAFGREKGSEPVFVPETGPSGAPVLDGGAPACGARTGDPPTAASWSTCSTTSGRA